MVFEVYCLPRLLSANPLSNPVSIWITVPMTQNKRPAHGNEHLGKKGEARFTEICNDAELACNPSVAMDKRSRQFLTAAFAKP